MKKRTSSIMKVLFIMAVTLAALFMAIASMCSTNLPGWNAELIPLRVCMFIVGWTWAAVVWIANRDVMG